MTHRIALDGDPIDSKVTTKAFWTQALERSVKTAVQNVPVFFAGGIALADINWRQALVATLVTVIFSLLMSLASSKLYESQGFSIDLAQRAVRTFIATFVGALTTLDSLDVAEWKQAASFALSAVVLSIVTSTASRNVGTTGTASMLPGADLVPVAIGVARPIVEQTIEHVAETTDDLLDTHASDAFYEAKQAMDRLGG